MKKLSVCLSACVIALLAMKAGAATVMTATDGDVNFLFGDLQGYELYMFDDDAFGSDENLLVPVPSLVRIDGPQSDANGTFNLATNSNGTLRLDGDSPQFVVGVTNDGGNSWVMDENPVWELASDSVQLQFMLDQNTGSVITVDVQPVPLPAAAWLFGSALLGMITVSRRRKQA